MDTIQFYKLKGTVNFYFIRHGQSAGNKGHIFQGRKDFPLTSEGEAQSAAAGSWFLSRGIDTLITSPLQRSLQTAEIITDILAASSSFSPHAPIIDDNLMELDTGIFSGLTFTESSERFPEVWEQFKLKSWEGVTGAERISSLLERAVKYWNKLIDLSTDGSRNVVTVTHGGLLQWIIKATFGHSSWMPLFPTKNCGIYQFNAAPSWEKPGSPEKEKTFSYVRQWKLINYVPDQHS